jgi:hypothetical protein
MLTREPLPAVRVMGWYSMWFERVAEKMARKEWPWRRGRGRSCKLSESQLSFVLAVAGAVAGWRDYVDAYAGARSSLEQLEVKD